MNVLALIIVALVAAGVGTVAGAYGGRWLVWREWEAWDHDLREALDNAAASAGRANVASAKVEKIAAEWPEALKLVEQLHEAARRSTPKAQEAERLALATAARMQELEQAIAASFSITLTKRG